MKKRLDKTAYGGICGKNYIPFNENTTLKATQNSGLVIVIGIILAVLFAASNTYAGMKTGLTVAAGIPGVVIGASVMKGLKKDNILSPTLLQGMASGGESIASGMIYVLPAIIIIGGEFTFIEAIVLGIAGALLGISIASIVQNNLIVEEHGNLTYPEAMAISETLVATEEGGEPLLYMLTGATIGAIYTAISDSFMNLVNRQIKFTSDTAYKWSFGLEVNPMLLGIGFIVGLDVSTLMMAGAVASSFLITPLIMYFTAMAPDTVVAWNNPYLVVNAMTIGDVTGTYTKYIGAGAMLGGGFIGVVKLIPVIISSIKEQLGSKSSEQDENNISRIILGIGLTLLFIAGYLASKGNIVMFFLSLVLTLAFIFMFVVVAGRLTGNLGTSNLPVSGMTIASLVMLTMLFVFIDATSAKENQALLMFGTVIVTAIAVSGGFLQSQKVSFIIGGSPNSMMKNFTLAAMAGVVTVVSVIMLAAQSETFVNDFTMPQANLMATLTQGILEGNLPWVMIFTGIAFSIVLFLFDLSIMPIAVGFYLPLNIVSILYLGAILRKIVEKTIKEDEIEKRISNGISMSAGFVAGCSLIGIVGMIVLIIRPEIQLETTGFLGSNLAAIIQLVILVALSYYFIALTKIKK